MFKKIGMLVLQIEALECTQMREGEPFFQNFLGGDTQIPANARAFGASRWLTVPATVLPLPMFHSPIKISDLATGPVEYRSSVLVVYHKNININK